MVYQIPQEEVMTLLLRQLNSFFPINTSSDIKVIDDAAAVVFPKLEKNFANSTNKYFSIESNGVRVPRFNPFHSVQWMTFLYYLSHELYTQGSELCDKVYYLNKIMHSVDLFYAIELPEIWSAEHPLGSIMGRAKYSDGFFFYQGCTVGGTTDKNGKDCYPVIEENVRMYANSSILGRCHVGRNVQIGAGTLVKNQNIPADCIVFGQSPNLIIKNVH